MSFIKRIDKVKNQMIHFKIDGLYITNLTNVRYLTGFTGSSGSLLILEKQHHFFTDGRYIEQSKEYGPFTVEELSEKVKKDEISIYCFVRDVNEDDYSKRLRIQDLIKEL